MAERDRDKATFASQAPLEKCRSQGFTLTKKLIDKQCLVGKNFLEKRNISTTHNAPKMADAALVENSERPKREIRGTIRYMYNPGL
jgi:hypothetical protein